MKALLTALLLCCIALTCQPPPPIKPSRPNILLIVADDLGYSDLGCYGGNIETPNLDSLASRGIRFSRFHTAPLCAVTRAMLLSGNNNHRAGMGSQGVRTGVVGYEGELTDRVIAVPELLKEAGYHTYMAGKWHLGLHEGADPSKKGFDHSFALLEGAANHYSDKGIFSELPVSPYTENGRKVQWPKGKYSTDVYTDKIISYIDQNKGDGKPFFAYAAYTSPHWPLQVDSSYWKKYQGRYDAGYEALRESRLATLKEAGMIPHSTTLPHSHPRVKPWNALSAEEKSKECRKMELYAGMVDNLDHNIGRLLQYLKDVDEYENTIIFFISDNGAAGEDFYYHDLYGPYIRDHFTDAYESMGQQNSFISYGPQWAEAGSAPFRYYKGFMTEGGTTAPMIVSGPGLSKEGIISHAFVTIMDLAPTFYGIAKTAYPSKFNGKDVLPLLGSSLIPLLQGEVEQVHSKDYVFALEHRGQVMFRKGDLKLANIVIPFDERNFELYDLAEDIGEQKDLKSLRPDEFHRLLDEWRQLAGEINVKYPPPTDGEGL